MKAFLAAALLSTALLAGCSSGGDDDGGGPSGDAASGPVLYLNVTVGGETYRFTSGGGNGTGTPTGSASLTGTAGAGNGTATTTVTGSAGNGTSNATGNTTGSGASAPSGRPSGEGPLNVTVTLGARGLSGAYAWALDFGDAPSRGANGTLPGNTSVSASLSATGTSTGAGAGASTNGTTNGTRTGTSLPANASHTYTAPGNHTIRFTLTPAGGSVATVTAQVHVRAPSSSGNGTGANETSAPASGTVVGPAPVLDETGSFVAEAVLCAEVASYDWAIPATDNATGAPLAVTALTVTLSGGASNVDSDLEVYGPDGDLIDSSAGATNAESVTADGPIPAGTFRVVVLACTGVAGSFTVHGEATLVIA